MTDFFTFTDAQTIDADGTVTVDCLISGPDNTPKQAFTCFIAAQSQFQEAQEQAKAWVEANPSEVAPYVPPSIDQLKAKSRGDILGILEGFVGLVTSKYLTTDQARWPEKEQEAIAFLSVSEGSRTLADAATMAPIIIAANSSATGEEQLELLTDEMQKIKVNAELFRQMNAYTEVVRKKTKAAISGASTEAQLMQIVADAQMYVDEKRIAFGL